VPDRYSETFPSEPATVRQARRAVHKFASAWLDGVDATDFESAIGECLANVVEHGGGSFVKIDCYVAEGRLIAEIEGDGKGFLPKEVVPPPLGSARGYGLFLMHTLLDGIEFVGDGHKVRLLMQLPKKNPRPRNRED